MASRASSSRPSLTRKSPFLVAAVGSKQEDGWTGLPCASGPSTLGQGTRRERVCSQVASRGLGSLFSAGYRAEDLECPVVFCHPSGGLVRVGLVKCVLLSSSSAHGETELQREKLSGKQREKLSSRELVLTQG